MDDIKKLIRQVERQLKNQGKEPDFFELVRCVENAYLNMPRIGYAHHPSREPLNFGQSPYLRFPETALSELGLSETSENKILIYVYFFGLLGVNGPMPLEFTSYVLQRSQNYYDRTLRRFLDIINHKMLSLFYRAWALCEQPVSFDRKNDDLVGDIVLSLSGGLSGCLHETLPKYTQHSFSNFLSVHIKNRASLEAILSSFFDFVVKIIPNRPSESDLPEKYRCVLGKKDNTILGLSAQIGQKYYSRTKKFLIEIGPLSFADFKAMLPGSKKFMQLLQLVNLYIDRPLEFDLAFLLAANSLLPSKLNGSASLGLKLWLISDKCVNPQQRVVIDASQLNAMYHRQSYQVC